MPRKRRVAEQAKSKPPRRGAGDHPSDAEMMQRRRIVRELMLVSASIDTCLAAMRKQWPEISRASVERLIKEAEHELMERASDRLAVKTAKQEARLLRHIAAASADKSYGAVSSLEKTYADVAGTNAPVRVQHVVSFEERFNVAFQLAAQRLTKQQADSLLAGKQTPLGLSGAAVEVVDTTGSSNG